MTDIQSIDLGGGSDTFIGSSGDDTIVGGTGFDVFVFENVDDGLDTILDFKFAFDSVDMDALFDALDADQGGYATEAEREAALRFDEVDTDSDLVNDALRLTVADTSTSDPDDVFAGFSVTFSGLNSDDITALQNSMIMSDVV